jgi:hypothetical protein
MRHSENKIFENNMEISLLEFIEKYNLDYELVGWYINLQGKKEICRPKKEEKTKSIEEITKKFKWIADKINSKFNVAYYIDIRNTPFANIDIDEDIDIEIVNNKFKFSKNTLRLNGNTKGFHIIIENEDFINCKKQIDCLKHFEGDIITDTLMETIDKPIHNFEIVKVSNEDIKKIANFKFEKSKSDKTLIKNEITEITEIKNNETAIFHGNYDQLEEIIYNIPTRYSDNYLDWIKIISILKKYNFYDLAKSFSQKSKSFIEEKFENDYKNSTSFTEYNIGTIYHYSKNNKTQYEKIINKYLKLEKEKNIQEKLKEAQKDYEKLEEEFNKTHFKVIKKSLYFEEDFEKNDIKLYTLNDLKTSWSHLNYEELDKEENIIKCSFINKYVSHKGNPRIYTDINVYPDASKCPANHYNSWKKFDVELINNDNFIEDKSGLEFILNHINILCNHQKDVYEFVLDFFAHMFQKPAEKPGKFILFISKQGTGKGLLIELLNNMLGNDKVLDTTRPEKDCWGDFNSAMLNTYLVNFEELKFLSTKGNEGSFKNYITQKKMNINQKGKDCFEITSYHRFIGSCNPEDSDIPIKTVDGDRRTLMIRCSDENKDKTEYFDELLKLVASKNLQKTFYNYLMDRKNIDTFVSRKIPKTEYQEDLKEACEDYTLQFIKDYVQEINDCDIKEVQAKTLFKKFQEFITENNFKVDISNTRFGLKLKNLGLKNIIKGRNNKGFYYKIYGIKLYEELGLGSNPYVLEEIDSD